MFINHLNFTRTPFFLTSYFTFSAEGKENELQEARAHGARLDSVNCGPGNSTDPTLAALNREELRKLIEEGMFQIDVSTIPDWISGIPSHVKTKVHLFLKHIGLCGGDEGIHTSKKRTETPLQNEKRTIGYFYRDHENIPPRNSSPAASTFLSPGRLSKRDAGLNDITAQYSNRKKRPSSGMMHADHSSISNTPINKRAKLEGSDVDSFVHSPFTPCFSDIKLMDVFNEEESIELQMSDTRDDK